MSPLDRLRRELDQQDAQEWEAWRERKKEQQERQDLLDAAVAQVRRARSVEVSDAVARRRVLRLRERTNEIRETYGQLVHDRLPHERVNVAEALNPPRSEKTIQRHLELVRQVFGIELTWPPGQNWTLP